MDDLSCQSGAQRPRHTTCFPSPAHTPLRRELMRLDKKQQRVANLIGESWQWATPGDSAPMKRSQRKTRSPHFDRRNPLWYKPCLTCSAFRPSAARSLLLKARRVSAAPRDNLSKRPPRPPAVQADSGMFRICKKFLFDEDRTRFARQNAVGLGRFLMQTGPVPVGPALCHESPLTISSWAARVVRL